MSQPSTAEKVRVDLPTVTSIPGVAEVVLCNARRLNTMDAQFFAELHSAFDQVDKEESVNCVILRAEGKLFTAGLDLKQSSSFITRDSSLSAAENNLRVLQMIQRWQASISRIDSCKKPVIAAIHSHCIGGGVDIITACDIRLATRDATFTVMETKLAIVADLGTLQRLSRVIGKGVAREMAFTAERVSAERALQVHLVNRLFDDQQALIDGARAMAKQIAGHSPLVVQATKLVMNYSDEHSVDDGLRHVAMWNTAMIQSDDLIEAVSSFLEKRHPHFRNRL